MITIKEYLEPTNVYILSDGLDCDKFIPDFKLTDDYQSLKVESNNSYTYLETMGFVYILTESELRNNLHNLELDNYGDYEAILVKDYVGKIQLQVLVEGEDFNIVDRINETNFIKEDYLMYSIGEEGDELEDIVLSFDCDYKIKEVNLKELVKNLI